MPEELDIIDVMNKISVGSGSPHCLLYNGDINCNSEIKIDDAQLIYDLYSGWNLYRSDSNFNLVPMISCLEADVNGDGTVNIMDVRLVVSQIINSLK